MPLYRATKISDIMDFSKYPVPVHVDEEAEKRQQGVAAVFPDTYKPIIKNDRSTNTNKKYIFRLRFHF
jgi:hypothetical protein